MTYTIVIPPKYLEKLIEFRECFKKSIRSQIMEAIKRYIEAMEGYLVQNMI